MYETVGDNKVTDSYLYAQENRYAPWLNKGLTEVTPKYPVWNLGIDIPQTSQSNNRSYKIKAPSCRYLPHF